MMMKTMLLAVTLSAAGCAGGNPYLERLKTCGVQVAPAGAVAGVELALRRLVGWEEELARLGAQFGTCMIRAEVARVAEAPTSAVGLTHAALSGGESELGGTVTQEEVQRRAKAWLGIPQ